MIRVLLSLDLTNKESERDNFNNFLAEQQWKKLAGVNTVWAIEYDDFSQTNEQLMAQLQRIEQALGQSMTRSDEQLAYYVAQAREIIDLSIGSQKDVLEALQQRQSEGAV